MLQCVNLSLYRTMGVSASLLYPCFPVCACSNLIILERASVCAGAQWHMISTGLPECVSGRLCSGSTSFQRYSTMPVMMINIAPML